MSIPTSQDDQGSSTRPYLIRALHEWCTDNGFTPYLAVHVGPRVQVPREYVKNNEIVLNVGFDATSGLKLGNEFVEFKARFGGASREIIVPIEHVVAIYARENGQGMAFPVPSDGSTAAPTKPAQASGAEPPVHGLRLAPAQHDSAPRPVPALVEVGPAAQGKADGSNETPTQPPTQPPTEPPPGPARPALKRVK